MVQSTFWMKLHYKTLDDPEIGFLPDPLWRKRIELMLLAGEHNQGGDLPPIKRIAWRLHLSLDECEELLDTLQCHGVVTTRDKNKPVTTRDSDVTKTGENSDITPKIWHVVGFSESQKRISDVERKRQSRKRAKYRLETPKSHNTVTAPDTDHEDHDHDDGNDKNNELLRESAAILGLDLQGIKKIPAALVHRWAEAVDNIPDEWGPGLLVRKMQAGELPPEPVEETPAPAPENLPDRVKPTPAQTLWKQIKDANNVYSNAFSGTNAINLGDDVLTVSAPEMKVELLENRLNGALARSAETITGKPIVIEYEVIQ